MGNRGKRRVRPLDPPVNRDRLRMERQPAEHLLHACFIRGDETPEDDARKTERKRDHDRKQQISRVPLIRFYAKRK